jgi:hypothetical protein
VNFAISPKNTVIKKASVLIAEKASVLIAEKSVCFFHKTDLLGQDKRL